MADQEYVAALNIDGNSKKSLDETAKAADGASQAVDKADASIGGMDASTGLLIAKLAALKVILVDSTQSWLKLDQAQGQLRNAFERTGATIDEVNAATSLQTQLLDDYGVSLLESTQLMRRLIDASGSASAATRDLALANDIAAQSELSLAQATQLLEQVRSGNIRGLERLRGITIDQTRALNAEENQVVRTNEAILLLTEAYAGAAEANAGLIDQQASFIAQGEELLSTVGRATVGFGQLVLGIFGLSTASKDAGGFFREFNNAFSNFVDQALMVGQALADIRDGLLDLSIFENGIGETLVKAQRERNKAAAEEKRLIDERAQARKEEERIRAAAANAAERDRARLKSDLEDFRQAFANDPLFYVLNGWEVPENLRPAGTRRASTAVKDELEEILSIANTIDPQQAADKLFEEDLRNRIAELRLQDRDLEAETLRIQESKLTELEKELALRDLQARALDAQQQSEKRLQQEYQRAIRDRQKQEAALARQRAQAEAEQIRLLNERLGILSSLGGAIANVTKGQVAAAKTMAIIDGSIYAYKAIASAAAFNWWSAAKYTASSINAFALAGRSGGGAVTTQAYAPVGGNAPIETTSRIGTDTRRQAQGSFGGGGSNVNVEVVYQSTVAPTPQQAREVTELTQQDLKTVLR